MGDDVPTCGVCHGVGDVGGVYGLTPSHCECRYTKRIAIIQSDRDAAAWSTEQAGFTAEAEAIRRGDRDDRRRVQSFTRYRAALAAMPTSEAIRADERGRVIAIMRDVIRSFQECDGYELAGQMRIRLDRLTGGGE